MFSARQQQLLNLIADGEFHSGNELASLLAISRTSIWKQLQAFADCGLEISAVKGKGYRLRQPLDLLAVDHIMPLIPEHLKPYLSELEVCQRLNSTNTYLMEAAQHQAASGRVCLAEYQTHGKGRRGRQWVSPFGSNIYLSLLWRFQQGLGVTAGLSLVVGLAVVKALRALGYQEVGLKWPNDIYWQHKKLGGILVEATGEVAGPCAVVIGLGLNSYLPIQAGAEIEQAWVDLQQITGIAPARNQLAADLISALLDCLSKFADTPLATLLQDWSDYDCMQDKQVQVLVHQQQINGIVRGINAAGLLLLELADGKVQAFSSGELSFNQQHHETTA